MRRIFVFNWLRGAALAGLLTLLVVTVNPAFAVLGENQASVNSDQARLKASVRSIRHQFYSVQEMQTPSGTTVRQFISPEGVVFGVTWQGAAPNLEQLLGAYFDSFEASSNRQRSPRGRGIHIDDGDLVVDTGGHMRFVVGRAFLRSKMPPQVTDDDIR